MPQIRTLVDRATEALPIRRESTPPDGLKAPPKLSAMSTN